MNRVGQVENPNDTDPARFFKFSSEERMRSQAMRRRQNKLYMNKLPKQGSQRERVLIPSKVPPPQQSLVQPQRAANSLQMGIGAPDSETAIEVAAWMGLQRDRFNTTKEVAQHMNETG